MLNHITKPIKRALHRGLLFSSFLFFIAGVHGLSAEKELQKRLIGKAGNYGMAGCGVGSMIWGKKKGQLFAATTNGALGNQLLGITFGTSNCDATTPDDSAHLQIQKERELFVAVNYNFLELEMASGQGRRIQNFAALFGCPMNSDFSSMSQKNHAYFFEVSQKDPQEFVHRVQSKIKSDRVLSMNCELQV